MVAEVARIRRSILVNNGNTSASCEAKNKTTGDQPYSVRLAGIFPCQESTSHKMKEIITIMVMAFWSSVVFIYTYGYAPMRY